VNIDWTSYFLGVASAVIPVAILVWAVYRVVADDIRSE
jgi:hypothetical protein